MAITKDKKQALVSELTELFANAKGTAVATYQGISVAELQELRKSARAEGVVIKVVKNRLVRISMSSSDTYKETDTSALVGQLLYAFSADDEVAPAKVLNEHKLRSRRLLDFQANSNSSPRWLLNCFHQFTILPTAYLAISMHCLMASLTKLLRSLLRSNYIRISSQPQKIYLGL